MRKLSEIEKAIEETQSQVELLNRDKQKTESDLEKLKESNARLLKANAGKEREPASLRNQREQRLRLATKVEEIENALQLFAGEIRDLEREHEGAKGKRDLEAYFTNRQAYLNKRKDILRDIENMLALAKQIESKAESLNHLLNPLNSLQSIAEKYGATFDLEALKAGSIQEPKDNAAFVNNQIRELLPLTSGQVNLVPFQNLVNHLVSSDPVTMAYWRRELLQHFRKTTTGHMGGMNATVSAKGRRPFAGPEKTPGRVEPPGAWPEMHE
jgi:chromosome segregation ATPase